MSNHSEPLVRVLDIRRDGPDMSFLDKLDRVTAQRRGLVDRVVVIDNTHSLLDNHLRFQRLVSLRQVRAVICVAVGPIDDGEVALRQSAALQTAGVTLWVGDEWGSRWAGGTDRPRPITNGPPALPDLIIALSDRGVFDEVFEAVRLVPYQAACPGLDVIRPAADAAELRFLRAKALDEFVRHSLTGPVTSPVQVKRHDVDPGQAVIASDSPLEESKQALRRAIDAMAAAAAAAPGFQALLTGRPRVDTAAAVAAFDNHLAQIDELLTLLDNESAGQGSADRLRGFGIHPVEPSDNPALATELRELVATGLRDGRSLRDLAADLRRISNQSGQGGSGQARAELAAAAASLPSRTYGPAGPAIWPVPMTAMALLTGFVTAAATWLASSSLAGGAVGLVWAALIALFVWRLPGWVPSGQRRSDWAAIAGGPVIAAIGVLVGSLLPSAGVPDEGVVIVVAAAVVVAFGATAAAWRYTIGRWTRTLRVVKTRELAARVWSIVEKRVRDRADSLRRGRRLSDATMLLAAGVNTLGQVYSERVARDRPPEQTSHGTAMAELLTVLRGDLVSLAVRALDDYLLVVGTDSPLTTTDPDALRVTAERDLSEYQDFLDRHGVHNRPPMVGESSAREALSRALWRSDAGRRLLRSDGREELVQLCQAGDVRALNVAWKDIHVLRFAPAAVQHIVSDGPASADVIATGLDMIGLLRLIPLGAGRVVHEQPTYTETDRPMDGTRD
ncbi:hypothetical protein DMH04_45805 [Kibdelosporangium aridum]|uniref:Uncharacterized protein n=1 Tax=Kibdelosporangium aridum TaxID=2030 RepID=A0A428YNF7_KIBAR|nr:hypothetical protein [Kibdelosporangium aridum]RSM69640.1 hypothetical protein DMH04_45805 [Kibdelosporangium aridum]